MAYAYFDSSYAPCAFLIVPDDGDPYDDSSTVLVQTDWDYPGVAQSMSWDMRSADCEHSFTDGTVKCEQCGKEPSEFISEAIDYIREHAEESFSELDEYLVRS